MTIVKLSEIERDDKRRLIRRAGFETQYIEKRGWRLIDKKCNADQFIDTLFRNLDDIIRVLSEYLLKVGYIIIN